MASNSYDLRNQGLMRKNKPRGALRRALDAMSRSTAQEPRPATISRPLWLSGLSSPQPRKSPEEAQLAASEAKIAILAADLSASSALVADLRAQIRALEFATSSPASSASSSATPPVDSAFVSREFLAALPSPCVFALEECIEFEDEHASESSTTTHTFDSFAAAKVKLRQLLFGAHSHQNGGRAVQPPANMAAMYRFFWCHEHAAEIDFDRFTIDGDVWARGARLPSYPMDAEAEAAFEADLSRLLVGADGAESCFGFDHGGEVCGNIDMPDGKPPVPFSWSERWPKAEQSGRVMFCFEMDVDNHVQTTMTYTITRRRAAD